MVGDAGGCYVLCHALGVAKWAIDESLAGPMQKTFNAKTPGRQGAMDYPCRCSYFEEHHLVGTAKLTDPRFSGSISLRLGVFAPLRLIPTTLGPA